MHGDDELHLRRAIALASESATAGGGPFGAVVVKDGAVVAEGANRVVLDRDPTAHAEVCAIRAASEALGTHELSGCVVYASAEPCPMCAAALHWARVDRVVFAASRTDAAAAGFDDEELYREIALPPAARAVPARQALAAEGRRPFEAWAKNGDRVPY